MTFPPGALAADTVVTLRVFNVADVPPVPAGEVALGHAIDLEPSGVTFDPPAVIVLPYTPGTVVGADPLSVAVWVYVAPAWQRLGGTVDPVAHTVTIAVPHFTLYAPLATRPAAPPLAAPEPALPNTGQHAEQPAREAVAATALLLGIVGLAVSGLGLRRRAR